MEIKVRTARWWTYAGLMWATLAGPAGANAQAASGWPESCATERETIFDRVVEIHEDLLPLPAVERHEPALGIEGRYVSIGDVRLWVEEVGEGDPILLISGGPGTSHHYFHPDLLPASRFARLIYVDLRGVGQSDPDPEGRYSVAQAVADIDALREALGFERWVLFGYSFGGSIAMAYALEYPHRMSGMILGSTALPMAEDVGLGARQRDYMAREEIRRVAEIYSVAGRGVVPAHSDWVSRELQAVMVFNGFMNGDWKRRHLCRMPVDEIARYARYEWFHDRNYYQQMVGSHAQLDFHGRFRDSTVPTLVLEGRWDLAFEPKKLDVMARQFPRATHIVLEDAGHTLFEDDPAAFFSALRSFLGGLAGLRDGSR